MSTLFVVASQWVLATQAGSNRSDLVPFLVNVPVVLTMAVADRVKHDRGRERHPG